MAMLALVSPILPGKTEEWREFVRELNGPRKREFDESRRRAGVHERTFLQSTPAGDLVITTLEGDDPARSMQQLFAQDDEFSRWFLGRVQTVHGFDPSQPLPPLPELVAEAR